MTLAKNPHPADGLKRQRRTPIPAQGKPGPPRSASGSLGWNALGTDRATVQVVTIAKNPHPADGLKRQRRTPIPADGLKLQRRAPIPAQGRALGTDRATAQGLKARPIRIHGLHLRTIKLTHYLEFPVIENRTRYRLSASKTKSLDFPGNFTCQAPNRGSSY